MNNKLRRAAMILCLAGAVASIQASPVVAQNGTGSHRRLQLPQNSPTQPHQQLARLLQYFQALKGESSGLQQGSSPATGDALSKLKQTLGPEFSDMVDQLPAEVLDDALKNPSVQNKVKEMLKQFSEDGQLPNFAPRNMASQNPDTKQRADSESPSKAGLKPLDKSNTNPHQRSQDRLTDLIDQLRKRNSASNRGGGERRPSQGLSPSRDTDVEQTPDTGRGQLSDSEWQSRLRELMQKQRDSIRNSQQNNQQTSDNNLTPSPEKSRSTTTPIPPELKNILRERSEKMSSRNSVNNNQGTTDQQDGSGAPQDQGPVNPSMSEFLDQVQDVPPPDLKDLGIDLPAGSRNNNSRAGQNKTSRNLLAEAMNQMDPQQLREQAKKALQDQGLRNTLKDILKDARQSAKNEAPSDDGNSIAGVIANVAAATGMEETMVKAMGGMTEELIEIAKDAKFGEMKRSKERQAPASQGPQTSHSGSTASNSQSDATTKGTSTFESLRKSASNAIKSVTESPEATASGSTEAASDVLTSLSRANLSTFLFLGLLIAVLVTSLFLGSSFKQATQTETSEQVMAQLLKQGIRCKEDVIRAFHQFALKPPHETQNWWTHSRVVDAVIQQYPRQTTRIQVLSALYEQARYLPDDSEFTDAQIQQATDAVRIVGAV